MTTVIVVLCLCLVSFVTGLMVRPVWDEWQTTRRIGGK